MYGCKMLEVLMANASHRLLMRCNNEVTQRELSWIIGVEMHVGSHTNSSSILHTGAEFSQTHISKMLFFFVLLYHSNLQMFCKMF